MSTIRFTGTDTGKPFEATISKQFPYEWKVTIGDRTRRGWGFTFKNASNNLLWALRTWSWPWHERAWVNTRAWVETLAGIPLEMHRENKAMFDLGDGRAHE